MKKRYCDAVAAKLNEWLPEMHFEVINAHFLWFSCTHKNNADTSLLEELGINVPKYYEEKHWFPGEATFDFFLSEDNCDKIRNKVIKEMEMV